MLQGQAVHRVHEVIRDDGEGEELRQEASAAKAGGAEPHSNFAELRDPMLYDVICH